MVSIVIPVYNSQKYLEECIRSILIQTYSDWEALFINEYGSEDGSREIILKYAKLDNRIKLIQNNVKLGLADSLNKGFQLAKGVYIARLDADDIAYAMRLEKQVKFMEEHPNVGVCGTYQRHFGKGAEWIHKPPVTAENCRANFLFGCDICHSTLMIRKEVFLNHHLFYDRTFLAEDFELWTRAVTVTDFVNIPEVLGDYRLGEENITNAKKEKLNVESGCIVANSLKRNLKMEISPEEMVYFQNWENPFEAFEETQRKEALKKFKQLLKAILMQNETILFYDRTALLNAVASKWNWACYQREWNQFYNVHCEREIFHGIGWSVRIKNQIKRSVKKIIKKLIRPLWLRLDGRIYLAECNIQSNVNQKSEELQRWIKGLEMENQSLKNELNLIKMELESNRRDRLSCQK